MIEHNEQHCDRRDTPGLLRWNVIMALLLGAAALTLIAHSATAQQPGPGTALAASSASWPQPARHMYTSTHVSTAIAALGCVNNTFVTQTIQVTDLFVIGRLRVGLNLNHSVRANLRARLSAPNGNTVWLLFDTPPSTLSQNLDVMFDDDSPDAIEGVGSGDHDTFAPYYDYTWRPYNSLAIFNGMQSAGTWVLSVCDKGAGVGATNFFSLWMDEDAPDFLLSAKVLNPPLPGPGESVSYTVYITNSGSQRAYNATMIDALPADLSLVPAGIITSYGQVTYTGSVVTWTGLLLPGAGATVVIPANTGACVSAITNTATITDPDAPAATILAAPTQESFEWAGTAIPGLPATEWRTSAVTGASATWSITADGSNPATGAQDGEFMAQFNSHDAAIGDAARFYSRVMRFPAGYKPILSFWMYHDITSARQDRIQVQVVTDTAETTAWLDIPGAVFTQSAATPAGAGWRHHTVDLSAYAGANSVRIGFLGSSDFGRNIYLDNIGLDFKPASGAFSYEPKPVAAGTMVTFSGQTADASNAATKTWDFGDGMPLQQGNIVTHSFVLPGSYRVTMTACGFSVSETVKVGVEADVAVSLSAHPAKQPVGHPISYTITVTNNGPDPAPMVLLTNTLAAGATMQTMVPTSNQGTCSYAVSNVTCSLGALSPASSTLVTIVIRPMAATTATNTVQVSGAIHDPDMTNNTAQVSTPVEDVTLYLPVVIQQPFPPVLNPIANSDGNGDYTVSWSSVPHVTGYILQEATNPSFAGAPSVYAIGGTTWITSGRQNGTYYYRVKAVSSIGGSTGESNWSNVQSVTVSRLYDGYWIGYTSQPNKRMSFTVRNSAIITFSFEYRVGGTNCVNPDGTQTYSGPPVPIVSDTFVIHPPPTSYSEYQVNGRFNSAMSASGNLYLEAYAFYPPCYGTANAAWTATRQP